MTLTTCLYIGAVSQAFGAKHTEGDQPQRIGIADAVCGRPSSGSDDWRWCCDDASDAKKKCERVGDHLEWNGVPSSRSAGFAMQPMVPDYEVPVVRVGGGREIAALHWVVVQRIGRNDPPAARPIVVTDLRRWWERWIDEQPMEASLTVKLTCSERAVVIRSPTPPTPADIRRDMQSQGLTVPLQVRCPNTVSNGADHDSPPDDRRPRRPGVQKRRRPHR
jgi:hypothetical protein